MFNQFKLYNYTNSLVSSDGFGRHEGQLFAGDIINGLDCVVGTGLQVTVNPGNAIIRYGSGGSASAYLVSGIATWTGTLATADASNPRIDAVVLFVKSDTTLPSGTPTSANQDGQGVPQIALVAGTPNANPTAPTATQIQAAIGSSSYPYTILWNWRVNAGQGTLSAANGTDVRVWAVSNTDRALGAASYVDSGGVLTFTASSLNGNVTAGVAYINVAGVMVPQSFNASSYSVSASQDTYFYVQLGNSTVQKLAVANGASSPTLPANSVWIGKDISNASAITSVAQGGLDSNGKVLYPTNTLIGAQQAWTVPTLLNSWVNYDTTPGSWETVGYMKDSMGFVHLKGMLKGGALSSVAFNLPVGYRTARIQYSAVVSGAGAFGTLSVKPNGDVLLDGGNTAYFTLNSVSFRAEQ